MAAVGYCSVPASVGNDVSDRSYFNVAHPWKALHQDYSRNLKSIKGKTTHYFNHYRQVEVMCDEGHAGCSQRIVWRDIFCQTRYVFALRRCVMCYMTSESN